MRDWRKSPDEYDERARVNEYGVPSGGVSVPGKRTLAERQGVPGIQLKREVGSPDDPAEHEADAVADRVVGRGGDAGLGGLGDGLSGAPVPAAVRREVEPELGRDLSSVRLHSNEDAAAQARSLGARAFTIGDDIGFARGALQSGTEGKKLLVHELAHTAQQAGGDAPIRRKLGPRLDDGAELAEVEAGTKELKKGDKGPAVSKVQQALSDLGHKITVSGDFDDALVTELKVFQKGKTIAESGNVDQATIKKLDEAFADRKAYATLAQNKDAPRDLSKAEASEAQAALSPAKVDKVTGKVPDFVEEVNGEKYGDRLYPLLEKLLKSEHDRIGKGKGDLHKDKANLHSLDEVEDVGVQSKTVTDKTFGGYASGGALKANVNLKDKFAYEDDRIGKMSDEQSLGVAKWRVEKIVRANQTVAKLNDEHHVDLSRVAEKKIVGEQIDKLATKYKAELLETHKAWPGSADPSTSTVYIQLFKGKDDKANRAYMWEMFGRLVHEYIHTLEHGDWTKYKNGVADIGKQQTLLEGVTEFLTRVALSGVDGGDMKLRKAVEGQYHDDKVTDPIPQRTQYQADMERAEKVVGIVGAPNLYAAYFQGKVDKIGGS